MKKYGIMLIVLLAVVIGGALYWLNKDNTVEVATEEKTTLSPTPVSYTHLTLPTIRLV